MIQVYRYSRPPTPDPTPVDPNSGLYLDDESIARCIKCNAPSGDDWTQCEGQCPVRMSPYFNESCHLAFRKDVPNAEL